jgi:hypothetical protein
MSPALMSEFEKYAALNARARRQSTQLPPSMKDANAKFQDALYAAGLNSYEHYGMNRKEKQKNLFNE